MRIRVAVLSSALTLTLSSVAFAQDDECPPGSWFCEPAEVEANTEEVEAEEVEVEEVETDDAPEAPTRVVVPKSKKGSPPPIVVYHPYGEKPPAVVVVDRAGAEKAPPPRKRRYQNRHGLNLRLQGVMMGDDEERSENAEMGGIGFSYRYRPVGNFALDIGLDFIGGVDWHGNERRESALTFNGIIYFNPKDTVQVYTLAGLGFSGARVQVEREIQLDDGGSISEIEEREYSYFGGQMGLGLEFKVGKKVALNVDVVGFIRGRTDDRAREEPEFTDPETGRTTNTSGGGLFRGGITFYW